MALNDEYIRILEVEALVACLRVLPWHPPGKVRESRKNAKSGYPYEIQIACIPNRNLERYRYSSLFVI
jgi:hypothetical protein